MFVTQGSFHRHICFNQSSSQNAAEAPVVGGCFGDASEHLSFWACQCGPLLQCSLVQITCVEWLKMEIHHM